MLKTLATLPRSILRPSRSARFEWITLPHTCLGVLKRFGLYLPPGFGEDVMRPPVLYLFRGQENEWAGDQDGREGLIRVVDRLIAAGEIEPLVIALPGFMPPDPKYQGCPINWSDPEAAVGIGNGRFEDFFFELKHAIETSLPVRTGPGSTALDGFSMGGYASIFLATKYPHLFGSAGAFDGSFMWPDQIDPRRSPYGRADRLWFSETCAPFFRKDGVWDRAKMERYNPIFWIRRSSGDHYAALRRVRFHVRSVADEGVGNIDRARYLIRELHERRLANSFDGTDVCLDRDARHTWKWADIHLEGTLRLHDRLFRERRKSPINPIAS